jgi:sarcosine oxidase
MRYHTIVVGLGAMGSAAAWQLARAGHAVLGLERFGPAHTQGSSHGHSRIIRQAYMEGTQYVPLILRAYTLWHELAAAYPDDDLLTITGGITIGAPDSAMIAGVTRSALAYGLEHEALDAAEVRRRFPPLQVPDGHLALYEPRAGVLRPEACIRAHLHGAARAGATLQFHETVTRWHADGHGVTVVSDRGTYQAERLIIAPGAWAPQLLADLQIPFRLERQILFWFDPVGGSAAFAPGRFPIYIWEVDDQTAFYGFPAQAGPPGGVKIAFHTGGTPCDPDSIRRDVAADEVEAMRAAVRQRIPAIDGPLLASATCMYTRTPDDHFVIGLHPHHPNVVVASPCSGHGFKFSSVIGEIAAQLAVTGQTDLPIAFFAPSRVAQVSA